MNLMNYELAVKYQKVVISQTLCLKNKTKKAQSGFWMLFNNFEKMAF